MKQTRPWIGAICLPIILLICLLISVYPVFAEGDGSGGGQNVPLGLASSSPANGVQNVSPDIKIKLVFNKNVINMTVKENNLRCFSLYAGSVSVPLEVQMADDQIYPELKRDVTLVPRQRLQPGNDYTVVISKALQAKNGAVLGQDVKIRFKTAAVEKAATSASGNEEKTTGEAPATVKEDSVSKPENRTAVENGEKAVPSETGKPEVKPESINKKLPAKTVDSSKHDSWIWPVLIIVIIVLGAGYGYLGKRR
ncbi:MAG: Ig-like domain-containing protein [Deltaproteobacteria bacterium]